jgi:asparagine synthase (glutamine-hydrolysing)
LKGIAGDFLPTGIVNRRKSGFGVPLGDWLKDSDGIGRYLGDLHMSAELTRCVKKERMKALIDEHRAGRHDHTELLWAAINLMLWTEVFKN